MIPKAREVRLKPKVRKVLEARCRAPTTAQRDVKRARIVLLAAAGRSTRSIAEEGGVHAPLIHADPEPLEALFDVSYLLARDRPQVSQGDICESYNRHVHLFRLAPVSQIA